MSVIITIVIKKHKWKFDSGSERVLITLTPSIKIQILLSCPHRGEVDKLSRELILGDHILNSY